MELVAAVVLAGALLAALFLLLARLGEWRRSRVLGRIQPGPDSSKRFAASFAEGSGGAERRACPLCCSELAGGERISSKLYPGKGDRIMRILGCPHCWPATPSVPRICPVCGQALDAKGWVTARYFERPASPGKGPARRHVHVLGCTGCRDK
jgi:hypothetical protein